MARKFERDPDDRIIGGVCGGLARYFGVRPRVVRSLFCISLIFLSVISLLTYILLWIITPARHSVRDKLSRDLRKKVRNLDRLADEVHQRMNLPGLSGRLRSVQELIESLLPDFEKRQLEQNPELRPAYEAALTHLPQLLENFLRLPVAYAKAQPIAGGQTAWEQLAGELMQLEGTLRNVLRQRYGQTFAQTADALDSLQERYEDDPTAPFRQRLESLQARASGRLDAEAQAKVEAIKSSLLAALGRLLKTADETDPNLYNVRQIALEYLPNTVDKYLALPPGMAGLSASGKTAQSALHEQLDVLDSALNRLVTSLYLEDAQGLLIHGHFLRDKFIDAEKEWAGERR